MGDFCGKCGTKVRPAKTKRGIKPSCPRCHPERFPVEKNYHRKTNVPCKDTGFCKPELCIKALDCEEMRRLHKRQPTKPLEGSGTHGRN